MTGANTPDTAGGRSEGGAVVVYWRPGCPYCARLRAKLSRIGLPVTEINIWSDRGAAARVRAINGGDETVPTVVVGDQAMVNPSAGQVLATVREHAPQALAAVDEHAVTRLHRAPWWGGAVLPVVFAIIWGVLATANPTTTYHLAPLLIAAAWPISHRWLAARPLRAPTAVGAAAAGMVLAGVTTAVLSARHVLAGPTVTGGSAVVLEAVVTIVIGGLGGAVLALIGRADSKAGR